ncbi:hypothetical protein [Nocardioides sp. B-3]|uniref:hypothetical protein n=1 Tax=Nocardioides sp. B-3 TaxID=2895565 RepID=UPI0021532D0D|nr:hypothetical protein [Nocardioides sp. B-3]UUZ61916.1 hypothetical protein LP418_26505 [Nocardioides sp. B-3]
MSVEGVAVGAVLCGGLAILVPRLIASVPEPAEPADDKEPYSVIAARPGLWWKSALICAVIGALIGGAIGVEWPLLFPVPLVPVGAALALIDWRTRLLPTRIIAPTYVLLVPLVVIAALASGEPTLLIRAAIGWALMGASTSCCGSSTPPGWGTATCGSAASSASSSATSAWASSPSAPGPPSCSAGSGVSCWWPSR